MDAKNLKSIEILAKECFDIATECDDIIDQNTLFDLQLKLNELYHNIKDLRKQQEKTEG